jgi:hypothetical protein
MCLPTEIPDAITVDATPLKIHDSISIADIMAAYPSVEFLEEPETTLVTVIPPIVEVVATPAEGTAAEPELIGGKPAEDGEAGEKAGDKKPADKKSGDKKD